MENIILAILSGGAVGFTLGLIGGGGSILATPLMLYVVGLPPHRAIGTSALAVSANAFINFISHARKRNVFWGSALIFAIVGIIGASIGSEIGKALDGKKLIFYFAILMIVVGLLMLRRKPPQNIEGASITENFNKRIAAQIALAALLAGAMSGFFGIGGGFLIVPSLLLSTGMPMIYAIGSSLLSVGTFGLTTAVNYALSGKVAWLIAAEFIGGGALGGFFGMRVAIALAPRRQALNRIFAGLIFVVAAYMIFRSAGSVGIKL